MQNKAQDLPGLGTPLFLPRQLRQRGEVTCPGAHCQGVGVCWYSLMLKNLMELESLFLLPHPVNNRHSISICGMYEARGDARAKRKRLGTAGQPGQLVNHSSEV